MLRSVSGCPASSTLLFISRASTPKYLAFLDDSYIFNSLVISYTYSRNIYNRLFVLINDSKCFVSNTLFLIFIVYNSNSSVSSNYSSYLEYIITKLLI